MVASVEKTVKILAPQGVKIVADKLIGDAIGSTYDLIILPVYKLGLRTSPIIFSKSTFIHFSI